MDTILYRNTTTSSTPTTDPSGNSEQGGLASGTPTVSSLTPACFYPVITQEEAATWSHWLPTALVMPRRRMASPADMIMTLTRLRAPAEVIEEFHWSWNMEMFDAYEVRTPVRRDARDPLLIGYLGKQRYRLALWGESLLPLERITALVHESLDIRQCAAQGQRRILLSGALVGLLVGVLLALLVFADVHPASAGLVGAFLGFLVTLLPTTASTPANRQHDFLDRYRC